MVKSNNPNKIDHLDERANNAIRSAHSIFDRSLEITSDAVQAYASAAQQQQELASAFVQKAISAVHENLMTLYDHAHAISKAKTADECIAEYAHVIDSRITQLQAESAEIIETMQKLSDVAKHSLKP